MTRPGESLFRAIFEAQGLDVEKVASTVDAIYRYSPPIQRHLEKVERDMKIDQLRARGVSATDIAKRLDVSVDTVNQAVRDMLIIRKTG